MRIWIDNTGLQTAALCIQGRASTEHEYDYLGLLQLATLVAFGSEIWLNGFEDPTVRENTEYALSRLDQLDLGELVVLKEVNRSEYSDACRRAARAVSEELAEGMVPNEEAILGVEPPELPRGVFARQIRYMDLLNLSDDELEDIASTVLAESKAIGAIDFMVSTNADLRKVLRKINGLRAHEGIRRAYSLNVAMRFSLNRCLAERNDCTYMASVARSELAARRSDLVLSKVLREVDEIVSALREGDLGIPSVAAYLLHQSKGDPEGVLMEARALRDKTSEFRKELETLDNAIRSGQPRIVNGARIAVKELGAQLRREVGLERRTKIVDAVSFKLALGVIPTFVLTGRDITQYWHERQLHRKLAAVSDIALSAAVISTARADFRRLKKAASRKSLK